MYTYAMSWFAFSIISITALAVAELTQQRLLNSEESPIDEGTTTVVTFLIQSLLTLPIIFLLGLNTQMASIFQPGVFPYVLITTILATAGTYFYFKSFKVKNISISTIFISSSMVISTALGIILFSESVYFLKFLGLACILLAIISLNIKNLSLEKNHFYGLLAGLFYGGTFTFDKMVVLEDIHPLVYLFWSFLLVSLTMLATRPRFIADALKGAKFSFYVPVLVSGLGYFAYNFCTFSAYAAGGEVGRVDAINNSQVFLIILAEYFILKQKDGVIRKIATALIAFSGVMILGFL